MVKHTEFQFPEDISPKNRDKPRSREPLIWTQKSTLDNQM